MGSFQRPVGAYADFRELEYVSALHQTALPDLRMDATVSATDILLYLRSKYGIEIPHSDAVSIVEGLGHARQRSRDGSGVRRGVLGNIIPKKKKNGKKIDAKRKMDTGEGTDASESFDDRPVASGGSGIAVESSMHGNGGLYVPGRRAERRAMEPEPSVDLKGDTASPSAAPGCPDSSHDDVDAYEARGCLDCHRRVCGSSHERRGLKISRHVDDEEEVYLDLVQLTSIIFMPTLLRIAKDALSDEEEGESEDGVATEEAVTRGDGSTEFARDEEEGNPSVSTSPHSDGSADSGMGGGLFRNVLTHRKKRRTERQALFGKIRSTSNAHSPREGSTKTDPTESLSANPDFPINKLDSKRKRARRILGYVLDIILSPAASGTADNSSDTVGSPSSTDVDVPSDASVGESPDEKIGNIKDSPSSPHQLDDKMIRKILEKHGMIDAKDSCNEVVREMLSTVQQQGDDNWKGSTTTAGCHSVMDVDTFARALISDINYDNIEVEAESPGPMTTSTEDVFGFEIEDTSGCCGSPPSSTNEPRSDGPMHIPRQITTLPYIDYAADTFRSQSFISVLWLYYIFFVMLYVAITGLTTIFQTNTYCVPSFKCNLVIKIITWMYLALGLSVMGILIIVPLSRTNSPFNGKYRASATVWSTFVLVAYTVTPMVLVAVYREGVPHEDESLASLDRLVTSVEFRIAEYVIAAFAGLLFLFQMYRLAEVTMLSKIAANYKRLQLWLVPRNTSKTAFTKRAAEVKVKRVFENAFKLHFKVDQNSSAEDGEGKDTFREDAKREGVSVADTMHNVLMHGRRFERAGGFVWTWKRIVTRELFYKEGVWIQSRLVVGQIAQVMTGIFVWVLLNMWMRSLVEDAEQAREDLLADPGKGTDAALMWIPEPWMIYWSFYPGMVVAAVVSAALVLIYIPSTVGTILQLRCGMIPSFHDPLFFKYRVSADTVFFNIGNMVYALLGSSMVFFLLFAGVIFLFCWPISQDTMLLFAAWCFGLAVTITIKTLMMMIFRTSFYTALYRKRPGAANLTALGMECWHLGVGGGTMLARLAQFIFAAAFWVGRIDVVFLADGVSLFGYRFDTTPTNYRKDLLSHDAHRHPFMERLGAMYMMKLAHGENFSNAGGTYWRNLFVIALLPWLMKYRTSSWADVDSDAARDSVPVVEAVQHRHPTLRRRRRRSAPSRVISAAKEGLIYAADMIVDERPSDGKEGKGGIGD